MKKITLRIFFVVAMFITSFNAFSQHREAINKATNVTLSQLIGNQSRAEAGHIRCVTSEMSEMKLRQGTGMTNEQFENWLAPKIAEVKQMRSQGRMGVVTIPVVVHVIHNGDPIGVNENIADGQVLSQIQVFNEDFRKLSGTPGDGGGVDTMIEFCMAQVDPSGNPTNGINRVNLGNASWDNAGIEGTVKPSTIWDPTKYLNMWTANFGGDLSSVLGYAQFPTGSGLAGMPTADCIAGEASTDGVVAAYTTFGSRTIFPTGNYSGTSYDKGRTMTHELGHMLGLRHLWGDGDCNVDDFCADTPNCDGQYYGAGPAPFQCGNTRMIENYMDYSDDIAMNTFTQEQADRMMAVLLNSPRRDDLLTSQACSALVPFVQYKREDCNSRLSRFVNEGTDCAYTEYSIPLTIDTADSSDAVVTFSIDGTSTANIDDIELVTPTVTFPSGSTSEQNMVVRILNDGVVEGDENLVITFTVSGSGAAVENPKGNSFKIIIRDNDFANGNTRTTIFSEDFERYDPFSFEEADMGGWTMNDGDGDNHYGDSDVDFLNEAYIGTFMVFDPAKTIPVANANWNAHGGNQGLYCFASTGNNSGTAQNDDHIFSPQIFLSGVNSELRFWARSLVDNWGLERFNVKISTTNTNVASFTTIQPTSGTVSPYHQAPLTWTEYVYDLSAYDGQSIYVAIHDVSADSYVFMVDDFTVSTEPQIQTAINTATADQLRLKGNGTIYTKDNSTGKVMLDIQNNDSFDYGCLNVSVNRSGTSGQPYVGTSEIAMDKVFRVTADNANTTGNATLKFYFTEAEVLGWETAASANRSELYAYRVVGGSIQEGVAIASIGAFGSDVTLEATFTGADGDFYFGKQQILSVAENQFDVFGVYPNPSNGEVTLTLSTNEDVTVSLFDIRGRKVYAKLNQNNSDVFTTKLNFSSMASGVYMLDVQSGSKRAVQKLVIQ